jgi:hypothetical protein
LFYENLLEFKKNKFPLNKWSLVFQVQSANLSVRSGTIVPGNQLTAPDKHKNRCGRAVKTALVYSVNEI